jgi:endonuclease/exonuclease/phosphatase family metal-dependent hydrolase
MRDVRRPVHALLAICLAWLLAAFIGACKQGGIDRDDGGGADQGGQDGSGGSDGGDDGSGGDSPGSDDGGASDDGQSDDGDDSAGDAVDPIGSDGAVDIAAWNIENFPADGNTPSVVADLITSLGLDLVAVEEIADEAAFDELLSLLPDYLGLLSVHEYSPGNYQKVGYIYRADVVEVDPQDLLFQDDTFQFPRPPFQVRVTVPDAAGGAVEFTAIVVHLKAGTAAEDRQRRHDAMITLERHVRELVDGGADKVVVLGDYNEILTSQAGRDVFAPFLAAPDRYAVQTDDLAQGGAFTFVPTGRMLDHIVTTSGFAADVGDSEPVIPRLDLEVSDYVDRVSDHLPVALSLPIL